MSADTTTGCTNPALYCIFKMLRVRYDDAERSGFMLNIGTRIQALRRNRNITQAQLAEVLSVSSQSVSKWENNLSLPDISLLPEIARYFGITMDELFNYRLDALNYRERFIRFMADSGALRFGAFRLQSGRISPYYINTGNYRRASQIAKLGEFYAECMRENNVECSLLAGNTHREIPIVMATGIVMFTKYGHDIHYSIGSGAGKPPEAGDRIALIKDTLTSGNTLKANLEALKCGGKPLVTDVIVSVDRMERGESSPLSARHEIENAYGIKIHAIVTIDDIIRALKNGIISGAEHLDAVVNYRDKFGGV